MAVYNVHGGHSLKCRGASKYLDEVTEDRKVKNKVINLLKKNGHTVYDCTDDDGKTQTVNLTAIMNKVHKHKAALDISIHLNAGGGTGVEVFNKNTDTKKVSDAICKNISAALGIPNRGTKYSTGLYVLRKATNPSILIECCFVDSKKDTEAWDADKCAAAIVKAICGTSAKPVSKKTEYIQFINDSIVDGLKSVGLDSSFAYRKKIAVVNGIENYKGTGPQNSKLVALARKGKLRKP